MNTIVLFLILSIPILWFSRKPLLHFNSHGFYRFFGWEATLFLFVNNYLYWFDNKFQWHQIVSYILLIYAFIIVLWGGWFLLKKGKRDHSREDPHLFGFEKTANLVESGIYRYIRHPLYASLVFLTWGIFFKNISGLLFVICLLATFFYYKTMKIEEKENIAYFGNSYSDYMKRSKMMLPFIL